MSEFFKTPSMSIIILSLTLVIQTFRINHIEEHHEEVTRLLIESDSLGRDYVKYADSLILETIIKTK